MHQVEPQSLRGETVQHSKSQKANVIKSESSKKTAATYWKVWESQQQILLIYYPYSIYVLSNIPPESNNID